MTDDLTEAIARAAPNVGAWNHAVIAEAVAPFIAEAEERNTASWVAFALAEAEQRGSDAATRSAQEYFIAQARAAERAYIVKALSSRAAAPDTNLSGECAEYVRALPVEGSDDDR